MTELSDIISGFIQTGRYKEAIKYAEKHLETSPLDSEAYEYRGIANYMLLNTAEALTDLSKAVELDSNNHKAYSSRANIYSDKQEYEKAINDNQKALAIAPENFFYKVELCRLFLLTKNYESCIHLCDDVLNQSPVEYNTLFYKASAFCDLKMYEDAIKCYKFILNNHPDNADIYNGLGFCQSYTGELYQAEKNLLKAISLNPHYAYPLDNLGYVYYLKGEFQKALELINESIQIDRSNSWAYKNRAIVYIAQEKREDARHDLLHALELGYAEQYDDEVNTILSKEFK